MTIAHSTDTRTAVANLVVDRIDAGSAGGKLKFYTASFATLICTITFDDPAFDAAVDGAASMLGGPLTGTCVAAGTAAVFRITDSDDTEVLTGSVGTSGADINLTSVSFAINDTITITAITYQAMP